MGLHDCRQTEGDLLGEAVPDQFRNPHWFCGGGMQLMESTCIHESWVWVLLPCGHAGTAYTSRHCKKL